MHASPPLSLAAVVSRVHFEWGRVPADPALVVPFWAGVAVLFLVLALIVWSIYRRDWLELPRAWGILLALVRTLVFVGLIVLFLQPQWRTEQEEVRNSRVVVLADTSSSMGLVDADASASRGASTGGKSRVQAVAAALGKTDFLSQLRKTHEVVVLHFDRQTNRIVALDKLPPERTRHAPRDAGPGVSVLNVLVTLRVTQALTRSVRSTAAPLTRSVRSTRRSIGKRCSSPPAPKRGWARPCDR